MNQENQTGQCQEEIRLFLEANWNSVVQQSARKIASKLIRQQRWERRIQIVNRVCAMAALFMILQVPAAIVYSLLLQWQAYRFINETLIH